MPGMAAGGYTGTSTGTTPPDATSPSVPSAADKALMGLLTETRDLLRGLKENGVKAPVVITEFEKKQAILTKSRNYGSRS
jgi:hypothetical protein